MQRGVVCLQGLPVIIQVGQAWSLDKCAAAQNLQALVEQYYTFTRQLSVS